MVPRMLGLDDLDPRALAMAFKCSGNYEAGFRIAVQGAWLAIGTYASPQLRGVYVRSPHMLNRMIFAGVKRSIVLASEGGHRGLQPGVVPCSIIELGALLRRHAAFTTSVRALTASPVESTQDALDALQFNMQV